MKTYLAIDLKSYYASAECAARRLNPLTTNLVVADSSRTETTICLAVSPSLKAYGIPGRARLFEVAQKIRKVNALRLQEAVRNHTALIKNGKPCLGASSFDAEALSLDPALEVSYLTVPPRMAYYMKVSAQIYGIYTKYIAPEDIHVYSIDEVFMDITSYLELYQMSAYDLAKTIIREILYSTGITAAAGIGSNLYLSKLAMDIVAKHAKPDQHGVRIAKLNEMTYRRVLWAHRPLTDFWRVGRGYAKKLEAYGLFTMGDIARCSIGKANDLYNENLLYRLFGVNAELLIDHAWGWEPCTMADIKSYRPAENSLVAGQVLQCPYPFDKALLVAQEMADQLVLDLLEKGLATDQIVLTVGYDIENLSDPARRQDYRGAVTTDFYGRRVPRHAHGTAALGGHTASA